MDTAKKKTILWVGDAGCDSGFARATHYTLKAFHERGWNIAVLGLNYRGDRHDFPYWIVPAFAAGGDLFGVRRLVDQMDQFRPDVVVFQNDPWNIPRYMEQANTIDFEASAKQLGWNRPRFVGAIAVDGKNCRGRDLNGLDHVIYWTKFAQDEAALGGSTRPSSVVPLGVDLNIYKPTTDKIAARRAIGVPEEIIDGFIFLNVNRNQPRKRLDLTIQYFAEWFHAQPETPNAYLYLHVCPTGDVGYDCDQLTKYYKLKRRVLLSQPGVYQGLPESMVAQTYHAADVLVSTTQGEGWGLTTLEAMACGIPCIVPDWAALGEWATAATLVPCSNHAVTPNKVNVIGGIPDKQDFIAALDLLYRSPIAREEHIKQGLQLASEDQYRWEKISHAFADVIEAL